MIALDGDDATGRDRPVEPRVKTGPEVANVIANDAAAKASNGPVEPRGETSPEAANGAANGAATTASDVPAEPRVEAGPEAANGAAELAVAGVIEADQAVPFATLAKKRFATRGNDDGSERVKFLGVADTADKRRDYARNRGVPIHLRRRANSKLTMSETSSPVQPGRHRSSMMNPEIQLPSSRIRTLGLMLPRTIEFFRRVEAKLIVLSVIISVALTAFVLYAIPESWQETLDDSSQPVSVLGAFLSFTIVFRTQSCYARWWEARTMWGRMTSALVNLSGQARTWFRDDGLADFILAQCVIFPYACKAVLRGNKLTDPLEGGTALVAGGIAMDADLDAITQHGQPPFACLEVIRRAACDGLQEDAAGCRLPSAALGGALLSLENTLWEANLNFGACLKLKNTKMPTSYHVFMNTFGMFYFALASLVWAPALRWFTPIITGFMMFLINTIIVVGDQMMRPFDLQWAGLPLQKYCVLIESEVMSISRRHAGINSLFGTD